MSHIYGDHMIMGQRSEGSKGERACLLLIDAHTGLERLARMLPHELWPERVQYITDTRGFLLPALSDENITR
jgi:hypothetical protein